MRKILIVLLMLVCGRVFAQEVQGRPPALVIKPPGETKYQSLGLTRVEARARIFGFIAETRLTMTFTNPFDRQLEGNLYFPLPEGATISGYALDVQGAMVDGVVVEKEKARVVFEKEVRKGIDPGLVEWTKGNNFKTRVYPIPPRGSRTVAVSYVSDLVFRGQEASYQLPLNFAGKLDRFSLRVEVVKASTKPLVNWSGPGQIEFKGTQGGFFAETHLKNQKLTGQLKVAVPDAGKQNVLVEKSPDGEVHFCINDFPADPRRPDRQSASRAPARIRLLWDASGSRGNSDHARELGLLESYFAKWKSARIAVDVVVFRNAAADPKSFVIQKGNADKLLDFLRQVPYDGGTQMGAITQCTCETEPDFHFLFSDGLSNFGIQEPKGLKRAVYAFSAGTSANHPFLRRLALSSGGQYFNLSRLDDRTVVDSIGSLPYSFISAEVSGGRASDLLPAGQPVHGRHTVAGKLVGGQATVTVNYGAGGRILHRAKFQVSSDQAASGDLLARFWAQMKLEDLLVSPKQNQWEMVALGKRYGLVTPGTSLIVLERLEQYLEHEIPPPRTLPDMRREYEQAMASRAAQKRKDEKEKLDSILAMWKTRVDWWNTRFKYPKDFRYQGEESKKRRPARRVRATGAEMEMEEDRAEAPLVAAPTPAPRPAPSEAMAEKKKEKDDKAGPSEPEPAIALKPWDPKTPYVEALKKARADRIFDVYLAQKKKHGTSPAFYLDCAEFFLRNKKTDLGLQVLSNVAEMELENAALLRILAHKLAQLNRLHLASLLFEEILRLRPEEPQSWRDLALVLADMRKYERAMELLAHVVMNRWDRFQEIEVIALMELNRIIPKARAAGIKKIPIDKGLIKLLDVDVRILLSWDADLTDIDLWVIEPSGEKAYYSHPRSTIGGNVSRDFTQGYGPEEYILKKAMRGTYKVQCNFYGSQAQTLSGAVTLQLDLFTNYGRRNEKKKSITLRLTEKKETITVGVLEF